MVEVEDDDVGFAAINTWVSSKVFTDERPILGAIPFDPRHFLPDVCGAVTHVMLTPVLRVTDTTSPLPSALGLVVERESLNSLEAPAVEHHFVAGAEDNVRATATKDL